MQGGDQNGLLLLLRVCGSLVVLVLTAPKAPLCKGSCHANSVTEGLLQSLL